MMSVVKGAVNTVRQQETHLTTSVQLIVCWADSPSKLEYQHGALTEEMATAWTNVFPDAGVRLRPASYADNRRIV